MAAIGAEFKGKAKAPSFYHPAKPAPEPKKESHWPLLIGGALAGAAILLYLRSKSSGGTTGTGSVLTVYPSTTSDQNQIQNMQGTVNTLLQNQNTGATTGNGATPNSQEAVSGSGPLQTLPTYVNPSDLSSGGVSAPVSPLAPTFVGTETLNGQAIDLYHPAGLPSGFNQGVSAGSSPTNLPEVYASPSGLPQTKTDSQGNQLYLTKVGNNQMGWGYTYSSTPPAGG
jgi:hypothetical protein